jgi:hypothetical protein
MWRRKLISGLLLALVCAGLSWGQVAVTPLPQANWQTLDEALRNIESEALTLNEESKTLQESLTRASVLLAQSQTEARELSRLSNQLVQAWLGSEKARVAANKKSLILGIGCGLLAGGLIGAIVWR